LTHTQWNQWERYRLVKPART